MITRRLYNEYAPERTILGQPPSTCEYRIAITYCRPPHIRVQWVTFRSAVNQEWLGSRAVSQTRDQALR